MQMCYWAWSALLTLICLGPQTASMGAFALHFQHEASGRSPALKIQHDDRSSWRWLQYLIPVGDDCGLLYEGVYAAQGGRYVWQAHRVYKLGCTPQVCIHLYAQCRLRL